MESLRLNAADRRKRASLRRAVQVRARRREVESVRIGIALERRRIIEHRGEIYFAHGKTPEPAIGSVAKDTVLPLRWAAIVRTGTPEFIRAELAGNNGIVRAIHANAAVAVDRPGHV